MARKGATPDKIIGLLRQADVELAQGRTVGKSAAAWRYRRPDTTAGVLNMAG